MLRKSVVTVVSLVLLASMLLSACGQTAPATQAPGAEVTLRWRTRPDNQAEIDVYQTISNDLDAKMANATLVYEPGGSETSSYQDVLKTEIGAGTAPDVFWIPGTDIADFATRGLILDMRTLANNTSGYKDADFYPEPMYHLTYNPQTGKAGDSLWGLPRDVSTFALYINLDLINEAGAPDPRELAAQGQWTWDAFYGVAEKVNALGSDIYGYGANAWWGPYGVWLNAAGGGFFNADRTACALDSDASIKGLEFQRSLYDAGLAVPYGEDSEPPFLAGRVGMFQNGRWATPGARSSANFNWDVVELPTGPDGMGNWLFWGAYVVNAKTPNPQQAWELVQLLTTAETQGKVAALGANIPSRVSQEAKAAFLTFTPPANNQAFLNGLANKPTAEGPLWAGNWPEFDAVMGAKITAVLNGSLSIDDFRASICSEANKAFP